MFCPQCGANQGEDLKFCKSCGANLFAVRQVVATRETDQKFDWSKTWVAEMFLSDGERKRRNEEYERLRGVTPESKREREIKRGVIVSCVGIGVSIFLFVLMQGIIAGAGLSHGEAEILSRLWIVGVIPFFIGLAFIINGLLVGRTRSIEGSGTRSKDEEYRLKAVDTSEFAPSSASVTEDTTRQLKEEG
ncbi:MAG: hypothetical protein DMF61_06075 [Blastocatellia bacterium AA13]|nr:MAG: hypothetical protein DMF61_06075 [Blastocatellia bacterium AA13]